MKKNKLFTREKQTLYIELQKKKIEKLMYMPDYHVNIYIYIDIYNEKT